MCGGEGRKALQPVVTNHPVLFSKNGQVLFCALGQKRIFKTLLELYARPCRKLSFLESTKS